MRSDILTRKIVSYKGKEFDLPKKGIYRITNEENGFCYVGRTLDMERRYKDHCEDLKSKTHGNYKLQKDWNKYGESVFRFEVLLELENFFHSRDIEKDFINKYTDSGVYNISNPLEEWSSFIDTDIFREERNKLYSFSFYPKEQLIIIQKRHEELVNNFFEAYIKTKGLDKKSILDPTIRLLKKRKSEIIRESRLEKGLTKLDMKNFKLVMPANKKVSYKVGIYTI